MNDRFEELSDEIARLKAKVSGQAAAIFALETQLKQVQATATTPSEDEASQHAKRAAYYGTEAKRAEWRAMRIFLALVQQQRLVVQPANKDTKPTRGRPRKQPGDPKSPYALTQKARKARRKAARARRGPGKRRDWTPAPTTEAAKN
jgi:hypothetical protein